jgi:hypothetical protein
MRNIIIVAILATATAFDVVSAAVKTAVVNHLSYAVPAGITVAVPAGMKRFPTDLLPQ